MVFLFVVFGVIIGIFITKFFKDENHIRRLRFRNKMLLGGFKQTDKGWVKE